MVETWLDKQLNKTPTLYRMSILHDDMNPLLGHYILEPLDQNLWLKWQLEPAGSDPVTEVAAGAAG